MSVTLREPAMTQDEFFDWAEAQDEWYESDGFQPVAMTSGTADHSRLRRRIGRALEDRPAGGSCEPLGPDAGVATVGDTVRYPDMLVTCAKAPRSAARMDRIVKLREYHAVPSIRRTIIAEQESIGLTVFARQHDEPWTASVPTDGDVPAMPETGIEIPVAELYAGIPCDEPATA